MNVKQRECLPEYLDPGRFRKVRLHFIAALTFTPKDSDETKEILQCKRSDGKYLCTNTLVLLIQRLIVEKLATCNLLFLNYFFCTYVVLQQSKGWRNTGQECLAMKLFMMMNLYLENLKYEITCSYCVRQIK